MNAGHIVLGVITLVLLAAIGLVGCPQYSVYSARLTGEAELAQAQQNRQIAVQEAQAKVEAAKLLAQAEVERARGAAQANQILGDSLRGKEEYLRYLWITDIAGKNPATTIYIPTEAGIPILESGRGVK